MIEYTPKGSVVLQPKGSSLCGPTTCNMIINDASGNAVDLDKVVSQFKDVRSTGVNIYEMDEVLKSNDIATKTTTDLSVDELDIALTNGKPVIVNVAAGKKGHFLIVDSMEVKHGFTYYMSATPQWFKSH